MREERQSVERCERGVPDFYNGNIRLLLLTLKMNVKVGVSGRRLLMFQIKARDKETLVTAGFFNRKIACVFSHLHHLKDKKGDGGGRRHLSFSN